MAKKEETISMVDSFSEFKELKNIDKTTMISVLEESFRNVLAKMFGSDENFVVIMNPDKGDCEIYQNLTVVADGAVENPSMQIGLTAAREIDPECEIGEDVTKEIVFEKFGRRAILTLRQTLSAGDYAAAESDLAALKAAVLKRDHGSYTSQEEIQAQVKSVESEIQQQKAALSGAKTVTAKASGTYSAVCDGYESVLTPEVLETMTPSQLSSAAPQSVSTTVGKLIQGSAWYFAANVNEEDAASLKENSRLTLRMASGVGFDLPVTLTRISAAENGKCLIVLKSTRYLSYMTLLREQNAELIISAYDGLRVPKNALRVDENGVSGVYCLVGRVAYFKPVSIVYQGSDYCLVEPGTIEAATESQKSLYTLRPNDEVIVSAGELYNGKVVD